MKRSCCSNSSNSSRQCSQLRSSSSRQCSQPRSSSSSSGGQCRELRSSSSSSSRLKGQQPQLLATTGLWVLTTGGCKAVHNSNSSRSSACPQGQICSISWSSSGDKGSSNSSRVSAWNALLRLLLALQHSRRFLLPLPLPLPLHTVWAGHLCGSNILKLQAVRSSPPPLLVQPLPMMLEYMLQQQ